MSPQATSISWDDVLSYLLAIDVIKTSKDTLVHVRVYLGRDDDDPAHRKAEILQELAKSKVIKDLKFSTEKWENEYGEDVGIDEAVAELTTSRKLLLDEVWRLHEENRWNSDPRIIRRGDFQYDPITGEVKFGAAYAQFTKKQKRFLDLIMPNGMVSYSDLQKEFFPKNEEPMIRTNLQREMGYILRPIKTKLKITGRYRANKDIFEAINENYRIRL